MRTVLAVVLGLAATIALSLAGQLALAGYLAAPDGAPLPIGRTFFSATLALAFASAVVGGFIAAHAGGSSRGRAVAGVALGVVALGVMAGLDAPSEAPPAVRWALPALVLVGTLGGGLVRATVRGSTTTAAARDRA